MTRLEAFLTVLASVVLRRPQGRHSRLATANTPAGVSDDTAPIPALTRTHPYQEPTA